MSRLSCTDVVFGRRNDAEPFDVALGDNAGITLPLGRWIPRFASDIHSSLNVPWVCVSGARGYDAHENPFRRAMGRRPLREPVASLLAHLMTKAGI